MNFRNFFSAIIFLPFFNQIEAKNNYCPYLIEESCSFSPDNNTNVGENYENGGSTFFTNPAIRADIEQGLNNFNTTYTGGLNLYCGRFFLSYESSWNWDTTMYSMVSPALRKAYDNYNSKFPGTHSSKSVIEQFYPEYRQYVVRSDGKPGLLLLYLQCHYYDHGDTSKPLQQLNIFGLLSHGFNGDDQMRIEYLQSERCTDSIKTISSPDLKMKKYLEMVLREFSSPVTVLNPHCPDCPLHPSNDQSYWDEDGRLWKWMQGADGNMKWMDLSYEFPEEGQNYDLSWKPSQENAVQNYHRELFVDKMNYLRNDPLQHSLGGVPPALEKEIWRTTQFAAVIAMKERHVSQQMNWWEGFIPVWGNARQGYYNFQIANGQLLFQVNGCVGVAMSALDLMLCDAFIQDGCVGVLRSPMNFVSKGVQFTIASGKSLVLYGKQSVVRLSLVLTLDRAPVASAEFFNNRNLENAIEIFDNSADKYIKYNPDDGKALVASYTENLDGSVKLEFEKEVNVPKDANASEQQMAEKVVGNVENGFGEYATAIDGEVTEIAKSNLPSGIASTFKDGVYRTVQTTGNVKLYRDFGNQAFLRGGYATTNINSSRNDLAILDEWNNSLRFEAEIEIPGGQTLNIGKVEQQPLPPNTAIYSGGADQVLLPSNWDFTNWVTLIHDKETGISYTLQEFENNFPNLIGN